MKILAWVLFFGMAAGAWADDVAGLQGKWSVKKTGDRGAFTQTIEFKEKKWVFKIVGADDKTIFVASGDIELKKQGPFNTARFYNIKAGRSDTEMEPVEDERNSVYLLDNGQFYLASNFDRARENEKPSVDAYAKAN